jgi:hypothetical protein
MMRGRSSRLGCTGSSVNPTRAMIEVEFEEVEEEEDALFGVPSSVHFPSTPISSYSSETSTSDDRDSEENFSLAVI